MQLAELDSETLVNCTIDDTQTGLEGLLKTVAGRLNAFGAVLWEDSPYTDWTSTPPKGELFTLASWFDTTQGTFAMHNLPIASTPSGLAVIHQKSSKGKAGELTGSIVEHPFLKTHSVEQLCVAPIQIYSGPDSQTQSKTRIRKGSITIYRRKSDPPFTLQEEERLLHISKLMPPIFRWLSDRASLDLVSAVDSILQRADAAPKHIGTAADSIHTTDLLLSKSAKRKVLREICSAVAKTFNCLEVSIFLEDWVDKPDVFELQATTWPEEIATVIHRREVPAGLTEWVLLHGKEVHIFNLVDWKKDKENIRNRYPGINWSNSLKIIDATKRNFHELPVPPISYMAVPIVSGPRILGVIRCSSAQKGPYYFSRPELDLLKLVAAQLAQCWVSWNGRRMMDEENRIWKQLLHQFRSLNSFVIEEIQGPQPDAERVFLRTLKVSRKLGKEAEINDFLIRDDKEISRLRFVAASPKPAGPTPSHLVLESGEKSPTMEVFLTGKLIELGATESDPAYERCFPGNRRRLILPISTGSNVLGAMNVWLTSSQFGFNRTVQLSAELLAGQLTLYHQFVTNVKRLREADSLDIKRLKDLESLKDEQDRIFQDLAHQLKGPAAHAQLRADLAVSNIINPKDRREMMIVRSQCRKVKRAAFSMGVLAALSTNKPIKPDLTQLDIDRIWRMIQTAAEDTELMLEPDARMQFDIRHAHFALRPNESIQIDHDLLEQALNNLFDNAAKYSYSNTTIYVRDNVTQSARFQISISNTGLSLPSDAAKLCTQRGWRSEDAVWRTGEGSGIGLFVVDKIMHAMGGILEVIPTRPDGVTEFRLVFSVQKTVSAQL